MRKRKCKSQLIFYASEDIITEFGLAIDGKKTIKDTPRTEALEPKCPLLRELTVSAVVLKQHVSCWEPSQKLKAHESMNYCMDYNYKYTHHTCSA